MIALAAAFAPGRAGIVGDRPVELILLLGAMALVPVLLVMLTAFLKIAVVLSTVRSALGAPQIPPTTAVAGLSLLLTTLAMAPVGEECWAAAQRSPRGEGVEQTLAAIAAGAEPLRSFLHRFARPDDRLTFLELARRQRRPEAREAVAETDFTVLDPAFVVSELRRAFTIGFLVFLPFLVVDLLVSNVLLAVGLTQLSPTSVSLPFKLLLFVAVDGWRLLSRGLVLGYLS